MFISEQYGWCSELSGEFFDCMMDIGSNHYPNGWNCSCVFHPYGIVSIVRDVDLMLMSL